MSYETIAIIGGLLTFVMVGGACLADCQVYVIGPACTHPHDRQMGPFLAGLYLAAGRF